jgi:hypothetical protein
MLIFPQSACQAAAAFCKAKGKNISKLAMQYSLANKDISSVLVGMNSVRQVLFHYIAPCFHYFICCGSFRLNLFVTVSESFLSLYCLINSSGMVLLAQIHKYDHLCILCEVFVCTSSVCKSAI